MIKKFKWIVVGFCFVTPWSMAQQANQASLYLMPSFQFYQYKNLNQLLQQAGFSEVGASFGTGVGGFGTINARWRVGGEGTYFTSSQQQGSTTTTGQGGLGYFYIGYVASLKKWQFVPSLGIGFGGLAVNATRSTSVNINDLLATNPNSSQIGSGGAFVHSGLVVERKFVSLIYLGLEMAYNFSLGENNWEADGLTDTIKDPFGGFQLNLKIGFFIN
jgi:hypothetical protein